MKGQTQGRVRLKEGSDLGKGQILGHTVSQILGKGKINTMGQDQGNSQVEGRGQVKGKSQPGWGKCWVVGKHR